MKALFWTGLVVVLLGLASLFIPIPRTEKEGVQAGGISLEVKTKHSETVSPIVSAVMILGGAGMMISGKRKA